MSCHLTSLVLMVWVLAVCRAIVWWIYTGLEADCCISFLGLVLWLAWTCVFVLLICTELFRSFGYGWFVVALTRWVWVSELCDTFLVRVGLCTCGVIWVGLCWVGYLGFCIPLFGCCYLISFGLGWLV